MDAAKKIILFLALVVACALPASALTPSAPENRVWEKITGTLETHQEAAPQVPQSHHEEAGATAETVSECFLAAEGASGLGDLTIAEVKQIQAVVNQAGRPLNVVGSAARGARNAASDIDYLVSPGSLKYFEGLEDQLPGLDSHGIVPGLPNPFQGPSIPFSPTTFP